MTFLGFDLTGQFVPEPGGPGCGVLVVVSGWLGGSTSPESACTVCEVALFFVLFFVDVRVFFFSFEFSVRVSVGLPVHFGTRL